MSAEGEVIDDDTPDVGEYDVKIISHENGYVRPIDYKSITAIAGDVIHPDSKMTNIYGINLEENVSRLEMTIAPDDGYVLAKCTRDGEEVDRSAYYDKGENIFYSVTDIEGPTTIELWYEEFSNADLFVTSPVCLATPNQYKIHNMLLGDMTSLIMDYIDEAENKGIFKWLLKNLGFNELKSIVEWITGENWTTNEIADTSVKTLLKSVNEDLEIVTLLRKGAELKGGYKTTNNIAEILMSYGESEYERKQLIKELLLLHSYDNTLTQETLDKIYVNIEKSPLYKRVKSISKGAGLAIDAASFLVMAYDEMMINQETVNVLLEYVEPTGDLAKGLKRHSDKYNHGSSTVEYTVKQILKKYTEKYVENMVDDGIVSLSLFVAENWFNYDITKFLFIHKRCPP